ncbi:PQQ-dependent sugar dehydrogenase [Aneurinibacillus sp. UBA3580]|uniref:PQQ-dependent sugar dehydrogenase n=1 Tax=Aneurinibacillus sp. UBA3580 TaxID=1946041 RepID=UPI002579B1F6|nr:PQQ-dependent sugar dehydrogenase [Aneurinibacillus sp. UBA3580]
MRKYNGRLAIAGFMYIGILAMILGCTPDKGSDAVPQKQASQEKKEQSALPVSLAREAVPLPEADTPYEPEVIAEGLNVPWALAMAPDGRMFFTERPGTLRIIENGKVLPQPALSFPPPFVEKGEGGLLGLAIDPDFLTNRYLYVYHSYEQDGQIKNRVLRLTESKNRARVDKVLLDGIPGNYNHNGGRLKIGPDGMLYITTGDALERERSQEKDDLAGKILRIRLDGTIPEDNPDPNSPVYSLGHRNPQGLAWHPETGKLYSVEHGQSAHDELNLIEPGANYGWPVIEGDKTEEGKKRPLLHSGEQTWAPSGIVFIQQGRWKGQLLAANLRGEQIWKAELDGENPIKVVSLNSLFPGEFGRIRDIAESPDGSLYFMTNNRDGRGKERSGDDKIIRLKPRL